MLKVANCDCLILLKSFLYEICEIKKFHSPGIYSNVLFMSPTLEKLRRHIGFGMSVRPKGFLADEKLKSRFC